MPLYDFSCDRGHSFEAIVKTDITQLACTESGCYDIATRHMPATKSFTTIVATTKTSKKYKAGYQHTHNRPKTPGKIQVGYSGEKKG